jgi:hypothetical protein
MNRPLSEQLVALCESIPDLQSLSINEVIARTEGRGVYFLYILFSLPFITPIPLPGVSTVVGLVFVLLGLRQALGRQAALPRWLGERPVSRATLMKVLQASLRFVKFLERHSRSRVGGWLSHWTVQRWHGLLLAYLGILLSLPAPPLVFFTNSLPAWAVILVCTSLLVADGFLIWAGYVAACLATGYFIFLVFGGTRLVMELMERWR